MQRISARYRYTIILLRQIVKTDFKLRYQGSILGYVWSLLKPLLLFLILFLVFTKFFKVGTAVPHYPVYLLLGIVLWSYFVEATAGSVTAIVSKGELLRKINFPRYVIILSISIAAFINLLFNFIVIAVFMYFNKVPFSPHDFLIIPFIFELFILSLSVAFLLSSAYVHFRDLSYIWDVLLQLGFYLTPIIYAMSRLPSRYAKLVILSPVAQILQDTRYIVVTKKTVIISQLYPGRYFIWTVPYLLVIILLIIGALYFRHKSKYFAEEV